MARFGSTFWIRSLALALGTSGVLSVLCAGAMAQPPANNGKSGGNSSWFDSFTSGIKQGFSKIGNAFNPSPKPTSTVPGGDDDAISLKKKGKLSPTVFVAAARMYEQSGALADAEEQYKAALKLKADDEPALLGYAQLKEHMSQPDEAIRLYRLAIKANPRSAAAYNNLGLCYAKFNRRDEAIIALTQAIALAPTNPLYRNNIAMVLVDQGRLNEAFLHLKNVHGEATAYYNLGYLLNKRGQTQAAIRHFTLALQADPSMVAAQRWIDYLQRTTAQARLAQHPSANGVKFVGDRPQGSSPSMADRPATRRLPPPNDEQPRNNRQAPGVSGGRSATPVAPLPPTSENVRPLPRVE